MTTALTMIPERRLVQMPQRSAWRKWGSLFILCLSLIAVIVDLTLVNMAALPMVHDLRTDLIGIQWAVALYTLILAVLTIMGAKLSARFGQAWIFILGVAIFGVGSLVASYSFNIFELILGSAVLEGIGGALILPAATSLVVTTFSSGNRKGALATWAAVAATAAALGPLVGGYIISHYGWRMGFSLNVGIAVLTLVGSLIFFNFKNSAVASHQRGFDWVGILVALVSLLSILFGVIESSAYGWFNAKKVFQISQMQLPLQGGVSIVLPALLYGILLLLWFVVWERRQAKRGKPTLLPMRIFRDRAATSSLFTILTITATQAGVLFCLPIFYIQTLHQTPFQVGLALLPFSLSLLVVPPLSLLLQRKANAKFLIRVGFIVCVLANYFLYVSFAMAATVWNLASGLLLLGIGLGLILVHAREINLHTSTEEGERYSLSSAARFLGATVGSSLIGAIFIASGAAAAFLSLIGAAGLGFLLSFY